MPMGRAEGRAAWTWAGTLQQSSTANCSFANCSPRVLQGGAPSPVLHPAAAWGTQSSWGEAVKAALNTLSGCSEPWSSEKKPHFSGTKRDEASRRLWKCHLKCLFLTCQPWERVRVSSLPVNLSVGLRIKAHHPAKQTGVHGWRMEKLRQS